MQKSSRMFQTLTDMSHRLSFPDREIPRIQKPIVWSRMYRAVTRSDHVTMMEHITVMETLERNNYVGCFKVSSAVDLALMLMMIRSRK
jgi:hypothetical protein